MNDTSDQFFRDASAAIVCFHLNRRESFDSVELYVKEINSRCRDEKNTIKYLVGLQDDTVEGDDVIDLEELVAVKNKYHFQACFKTSAKDGRNLKSLFEKLSKKLKENASNKE